MKRRWIVTRFGHRLHIVTPEAAWPWGDEVVTRQVLTACGHSWLAVIPGILTRIAAPRCRACCRAAGVPDGSGAWLGSTS